MTKVKLCYTAENADSDWLIDVFTMDEFNYKAIINRYVKETIEDAKQLDIKLNDDKLYLNFRMDRSNPILFRLIDQYMDSI